MDLKRLMLVEDDPMIGESLRMTLPYRGFGISIARNVQGAMKLLSHSAFDIAVVDVSLPDGNGYDLCRVIRLQYPRLPVLMLTARGDEASAIKGIHSGADDYVRKPCGLGELTARLNRLLDRRGNDGTARYQFQSLALDNDRRSVSVEGTPVDLRRREFDILLFLVQRAEEVVSRHQLLEALDVNADVFDRSIDSHLCRLRGKLKTAGLADAKISSIYGIGYRLEKM